MSLKHKNDRVYFSPLLEGPLAQPVEQLTFNQLVERSNRSRPTIFKKARYVLHNGLFLCFFYACLFRTYCL